MNHSVLDFVTRHLALAAVLSAAASASDAGSLHMAIKQNELSQVKQEIANGADVNEEDIFLGAPLTIAAIQGNTEIVELLLENGALLQNDDYASGTPLHAAAVNGHLGVVEILVEHGAKIDAVRTSNGETPLHAASEGGNVEIIELLITLGADVNARSSERYGPIHSAAAAEHFKAVEFLRKHGASPQPIEAVVPLMHLADPGEGARIFSGYCGQCHSTEKGGRNEIGPNLWGIFGRKRASTSDFDYSSALILRGGYWSYESLNAFIARPTDFVPGTKMSAMISFVDEPHERAHIIAYLRQLSDNPAPLPTP